MINARLDPEQGALVVKALQAAGEALRVAEDDSREELTGVGARGEGRDDSREELMTPDVAREPATQRRADALVLMAETLLAQDATALAAGDQHLPSRACGASTPVMSSYVPLWLKSNFSFLEGASAPDELVERAHALGLPTLALTDRDGVYGIVRAHMRAQELGIALVIAAGTQPGTGCLCTPNHGPRPTRASPRDPLPDTRGECYLLHMAAVGIRAIRQNASAYLRRVEAGETIEITDRGRPVALWVPLRRRKGIARLEAEARLSTAEGDLLALGPALPKVARTPAPSVALAKQRQDER